MDLALTAVTQLWPEVSKTIQSATSVMIPFLKVFGVTEGNGLSPFARDIESPEELIQMVTQFFKRPPRDPRDNASATQSATDDNEDEGDESNNEEEVSEGSAPGPPPVSATYIEGKLNEISALVDADEEGNDRSDIDESDGPNSAQGQVPIEPLFDSGDSSESQKMLRDLFGKDSFADISQSALKLTELLELGKIEQGSVSMAASHKSLQARWFGSKGKKKVEVEEQDKPGNDVWIERNTLVELKYKRGGARDRSLLPRPRDFQQTPQQVVR